MFGVSFVYVNCSMCHIHSPLSAGWRGGHAIHNGGVVHIHFIAHYQWQTAGEQAATDDSAE